MLPYAEPTSGRPPTALPARRKPLRKPVSIIFKWGLALERSIAYSTSSQADMAQLVEHNLSLIHICLGRETLALRIASQGVPHIICVALSVDAHEAEQLARLYAAALAANRAMHVERQPIRAAFVRVGRAIPSQVILLKIARRICHTPVHGVRQETIHLRIAHHGEQRRRVRLGKATQHEPICLQRSHRLPFPVRHMPW